MRVNRKIAIFFGQKYCPYCDSKLTRYDNSFIYKDKPNPPLGWWTNIWYECKCGYKTEAERFAGGA